ncbi:DNA polymerase I isoform X1 [Gossypium australe]|uniref:DNA polymerase I isoform X1 n=1 Tax=Gossypium australe TaxID=47621 RepID=A0A5B6WTY6_9ROSI|nr:DNA polymerase I isoform X1 [Gossypium australe]
MACFHSLNLRTPCLWTSLPCIRRHFSRNLKDGSKLLSFNKLYVIRPSPFQTLKQYCSLSGNLSSTVPGDLHAIPHGNAVISSKKEQIFHQEAALGRANLQETVVNAKSSNGRVMLIDGTSVIYRAYYKLLGNSCRSCFLIFCKGFCFHHIGSTVPFVFFFSAASLRCFLVAAWFSFLVSMGKLFLKLNMNKTKGLGI